MDVGDRTYEAEAFDKIIDFLDFVFACMTDSQRVFQLDIGFIELLQKPHYNSLTELHTPNMT